MAFWKDKEGKELTFSEFKERFKQGINEVTPIQRLESSIFFQQIMTLGFFLGLCVAIFNYQTMWWLAIILFGGLCMNIIQYKGLRQQLNVFKNIEEQIKIGEMEDKMEKIKEEIFNEVGKDT